ncbi:hypothetical protein RHSIM_Rhsim13G0139000 [Rhododendron simsii]|uniref:Uncharacterized protein n=1 Tax=Rhododendron simsii TaxID=118357 RepID=A0A834L7I5_RHOSS|nr:hypothetical protein RHSIM_Rhsim13G0139000 [Rhododendron simsii]
MLSMDGPSVNGLEAASADDNAWVGSAADKTGSTEPDAQKMHSGSEDLFKDSPSVVSASLSFPFSPFQHLLYEAPAGTNKTPSASPFSSSSVTQTRKGYDFSSLTQGFFLKILRCCCDELS